MESITLCNGSSILTPSRATQFQYKLSRKLTSREKEDIEKSHHFNKKNIKAYEVRNIIKKLTEWGVELEFEKMVHDKASANFQMLDCGLPSILAECLLMFFNSRASKIPDLCEILSKENNHNLPVNVSPSIYNYKLKKLLCEIALGMKPATIWNGKYDATGGFIIVEKNGNLICYHLIQKNALEDYLFQNTYLDSPSSSKFYSYGGVFEENTEDKLILTLQIRFKDSLKL